MLDAALEPTLASPMAASASGSLLDRLRHRYFDTRSDAVLSVVVLALAAVVLWFAIRWGVLDATWSADQIGACKTGTGACWSVIALRYRIILLGLYPQDQQWRAILGCLIAIATVGLACMPAFWAAKRMIAVWVGGYVLFYLIVRGGLVLPVVPPGNWGGLMLTLFIYLSVIAIGLPISVLIALARESSFGGLQRAIGFVTDLTRSLPLVTILFASVVVLPFVVPPAWLGEKVYRVIIGFALFFACYQSENIRAGLQIIPTGQSEAGKALGMGYWQIVGQIILPQAFKSAMPATINQFVITFKETSLVAIVGLFDLMTSAQAGYNTSELQGYFKEVYFFVGAIYFAGAFSLSNYGAYIERRFDTGTRH